MKVKQEMNTDQHTFLGWRVSFSILVGIGWLGFFILWLAFAAGNFTGYQNVAIILLSMLITTLLLGGIWIFWIVRWFPKVGKTILKGIGLRWRIWTTFGTPFALTLILTFWFYFFADSFTIYQNIGVVFVLLLLSALIIITIWSSWKKRSEHMFEDFTQMGEDIGKTMEQEMKDTFKE